MKQRQIDRSNQWKELAASSSKDVEVGDIVLLKVDWKERRVLDPAYCPAVVMTKCALSGGLRCASDLTGMLKGTFFIGDQCCVPSTSMIALWDMTEIHVALTAIAASESDLKVFLVKPKESVGVAERRKTGWSSVRGTGLCNCKLKCNSRSCSCYKAGLNCSSKCHQGAILRLNYTVHSITY
jgi:hypothetical protein